MTVSTCRQEAVRGPSAHRDVLLAVSEQIKIGSLLPFDEVDLVVHLYDGVHEPFRDLKILQNVKHVDFLIHRLWMTDVPHVNDEILKAERGRQWSHADATF